MMPGYLAVQSSPLRVSSCARPCRCARPYDSRRALSHAATEALTVASRPAARAADGRTAEGGRPGATDRTWAVRPLPSTPAADAAAAMPPADPSAAPTPIPIVAMPVIAMPPVLCAPLGICD